MSNCIDPIVGKILAGWRYDISGLAPQMRRDYEEHFAACAHCQSRQRLHRTIDISLIALASVSAGIFLLAFGVSQYNASCSSIIIPREEFCESIVGKMSYPAHHPLFHRPRIGANPQHFDVVIGLDYQHVAAAQMVLHASR